MTVCYRGVRVEKTPKKKTKRVTNRLVYRGVNLNR